MGIPEFPMLGRIRNSRVRVKDTTFSSRSLLDCSSLKITKNGLIVAGSLWCKFDFVFFTQEKDLLESILQWQEVSFLSKCGKQTFGVIFMFCSFVAT